MSNDLLITQNEIAELDLIAKNILMYSEDDRRKADFLFKYYQELIEKGDNKGETREALAKSLELREASVNNLIEILKLKTKIIEKKIMLESKREIDDNKKGRDTSSIIAKIEGFENETEWDITVRPTK